METSTASSDRIFGRTVAHEASPAARLSERIVTTRSMNTAGIAALTALNRIRTIVRGSITG